MKLITKTLLATVCSVAVSASFAAAPSQKYAGYTFVSQAAVGNQQHYGLQTTINTVSQKIDGYGYPGLGCSYAKHHGEIAGNGVKVTASFNADQGNTMQLSVYHFPDGDARLATDTPDVINGVWDNLASSGIINFQLSGDLSALNGGVGTGLSHFLAQDKIPTDLANLCTAKMPKMARKTQPAFTVLNPGKSISLPTVKTGGQVRLIANNDGSVTGLLTLNISGLAEICNTNNTSEPVDPSNPSGPKKVGTLVKRGAFSFTHSVKGTVTPITGG